MIYRVVIIDNGKEVILSYYKQGLVRSMDLEGNPSDECKEAMERAMDIIKEVEEL